MRMETSLRGLSQFHEQRPKTMRVKVVPKDAVVRKIMVHPTAGGFRAEGYAEWPLDSFTQRRLDDGDIFEFDKPAPTEPPAYPEEPAPTSQPEPTPISQPEPTPEPVYLTGASVPPPPAQLQGSRIEMRAVDAQVISAAPEPATPPPPPPRSSSNTEPPKPAPSKIEGGPTPLSSGRKTKSPTTKTD